MAGPAPEAGSGLIGPLAAFEGASRWVDHPYCEGVALIGDAAATGDPAYGLGLSLALLDALLLLDHLLAGDDWDAQGHAYAAEHDHWFGAAHRDELS